MLSIYSDSNSRVRHRVIAHTAIVIALIITGTSVPFERASAAAPKHTDFGPAMALEDVEQGSLLLQPNGEKELFAAPTVDTNVRMNITGMVARVTVEQSFSNPSSQWVNGIYVFPLPETAAVDHMVLKVGERIIEGQIKEREDARQIYQQAKTAGKKASLIEQQRPNIFTNNVANIGPGESVRVTIEYQQTLNYDKGQFSIRFPMTVGIRYIPGTKRIGGFDGGGWAFNTDAVPDASRITPPVTDTNAGHSNPVSIAVELNTGFPLVRLESPYHDIVTKELSRHCYQVELAAGAVPGDRDFELVWTPEPQYAPRAALFTQETDDETYGLLMMIPPETEWAKRTALAKEMIYVIDTSGSMQGTSIEQARAAFLLGLDRLKAGDSFNIVQFNSHTSSFEPRAVPATAANMGRARAYVQALKADGGTEMAGALRAVLHGSDDASRVRQVIFLTDGSVGNGQSLFGIIHKRLGDSRLFTVGIGSAPNSYFMREAASVGRGTFTYNGDVREVKEKMRTLFEKLEYPVLSNIELIWSGNEQGAYWPNPIRDLYIHEPLVVSFKLDGNPSRLVVNGIMNSAQWSSELAVGAGGTTAGLDVLWARNKIQSLNQQISRGTPPAEVKHAITELGLKHHIVTKHTSLVAVDVTPSRPSDADSSDTAVPSKKPHGWQMQTPQARLPQTATPLALHLVLAVAMTLLSAGAARIKRIKKVR